MRKSPAQMVRWLLPILLLFLGLTIPNWTIHEWLYMGVFGLVVLIFRKKLLFLLELIEAAVMTLVLRDVFIIRPLFVIGGQK